MKALKCITLSAIYNYTDTVMYSIVINYVHVACACVKIKSKLIMYIYYMWTETGKYTEVWQSSSSLPWLRGIAGSA